MQSFHSSHQFTLSDGVNLTQAAETSESRSNVDQRLRYRPITVTSRMYNADFVVVGYHARAIPTKDGTVPSHPVLPQLGGAQRTDTSSAPHLHPRRNCKEDLLMPD